MKLKVTKTKAQLQEENDAVWKVIREYESKIKISHCGVIEERLRQMCHGYEETAFQTLNGVKQFRDDLIVQFRALSLMLTSVGNATTHREKSPRLRAAVELIESAISQLRGQQFDFAMHWRGWPDLFASDLPTREFSQRLHALQDRDRRCKEWLEAILKDASQGESLKTELRGFVDQMWQKRD